MRQSSIIILVMAAVLVALLAFGGCGGETQAELKTTKRACIEMMQKVPVYYEDFEFWDVRTLQSDPDLGEFYKVWYERRAGSLEERFGIKSSSIEYLAQGEGLLDIIKADYDIKVVRDRISADFFRDTRYEDMEVWKSEPSPDPHSVTGGMVLAEGLFVRGANNSNVDDYLRVIRGEELSMYDKNAAEVLERLPSGIMTRISRSPYPEGLIVFMMSVDKETKGTYRWTNVYKFESPEHIKRTDAREYFEGIEDDFGEMESEPAQRGEPSPINSFSLEQDGEFVEWSVLVEEKYMIALFFYG
jgi:hypothetical protein